MNEKGSYLKISIYTFQFSTLPTQLRALFTIDLALLFELLTAFFLAALFGHGYQVMKESFVVLLTKVEEDKCVYKVKVDKLPGYDIIEKIVLISVTNY